jgi:tRNA-Thr(GGU) m(6)t(6)A37 methyltransferase TsaA
MMSIRRVAVKCSILAVAAGVLICGYLSASAPKTSTKGRFHAIVERNAANIKRRCSPEEIRTMTKKTFSIHPIGVFHSPLTPQTGAPRQGRLAPEVKATIEVFPEYERCVEGLESFSHIYVLFVFDRSRKWTASVRPPNAKKSRGVFSTRSPNRPNPIGLTAVRLVGRKGRILHVEGIDAFDNTPVVDIKPYVGSIDSFPGAGKKGAKELGLPDQK